MANNNIAPCWGEEYGRRRMRQRAFVWGWSDAGDTSRPLKSEIARYYGRQSKSALNPWYWLGQAAARCTADSSHGYSDLGGLQRPIGLTGAGRMLKGSEQAAEEAFDLVEAKFDQFLSEVEVECEDKAFEFNDWLTQKGEPILPDILAEVGLKVRRGDPAYKGGAKP